MAVRRPRRSERPIPSIDVNYRRLLQYLRPYWRRMTVALIALVGASLLGLALPLVIQRLLDTVLELRSTSQLNQLTLTLIGIFATEAVLRFVQTYNLSYIGERITYDMRKNLFDRLMVQPLQFHTDRRVGELVSRISSDTTQIRGVLTSEIGTLLGQSVTLVGSLVMMVLLNWRLMTFIVLMIPLIVAVGAVFGRWVRRISTERQDALADSTIVVEEALSGIRVVKSFVREGYENKRFDVQQLFTLGLAIRMILVRQVFSSTMAFIGFGTLAAFLWFGGREVFAGRLTGGELAAFIFYGGNVAGSIQGFVSLYTKVQEAIGATKRIFEIIDLEPAVADAPNAVELPRIQGEISFQNVSFSYDERLPVLENISLQVRPGEALALVGPSGAGKTTLFNLIPRFYDVNSGQICIDGFDIRDVTQDSLRAQIGLVPQDTVLFGGSIRDNILYGRLDATEQEMIDAAIAANAHDFISALPDGYKTIVGERGVKLSGGQRQRVAIARAILKDPRILLLDEATSALDSESEALVQDALNRLMEGRTTVVIAHRLSTIKEVDRIAVVDHGQLVELGTHEELMARQGLYANLYNMQFRDLEAVMG